MPEICKATVQDVPDLLMLVEQYWAFESIAGYDRARLSVQLERLVSEKHLGGGWIARNGVTPVGYLLAVYVFSLEKLGLTAELDEFFVVPQYRSQGIGASLLRTAEDTFFHAGCASASLQLSHGNDAARAFYRRHGYSRRSGYELLDKKLVVD